MRSFSRAGPVLMLLAVLAIPFTVHAGTSTGAPAPTLEAFKAVVATPSAVNFVDLTLDPTLDVLDVDSIEYSSIATASPLTAPEVRSASGDAAVVALGARSPDHFERTASASDLRPSRRLDHQRWRQHGDHVARDHVGSVHHGDG
jgi:hypothetical protein